MNNERQTYLCAYLNADGDDGEGDSDGGGDGDDGDGDGNGRTLHPTIAAIVYPTRPPVTRHLAPLARPGRGLSCLGGGLGVGVLSRWGRWRANFPGMEESVVSRRGTVSFRGEWRATYSLVVSCRGKG